MSNIIIFKYAEENVKLMKSWYLKEFFQNFFAQ